MVLEQFGNLGIVKALALFILGQLKKEKFVYLYVQKSVISFYYNLGFDPIGNLFLCRNTTLENGIL